MEVKVDNIEINSKHLIITLDNLSHPISSDLKITIEINIDEYKLIKEMEELGVHSISFDHPHTQNIPTSRGGIMASAIIGKRTEVKESEKQ